MKLNRLVAQLAVLGLGAHLGLAAAQSDENKLERVEVTGSSIKRLVDEGALPLETISADQIRQRGYNNAEDVLRALSANAANANNAVSSNSVFGQEADRLAGGGSYANLRGLGPTGTLVLLNGRRLSNQGTSGGSVDLNAIPLDAIERIEVLKDGASAIYGTDAIGGVINFILKRDFQGAVASANYITPMQGRGGERRKVNLTLGWGDLATQGFNLMGSITYSSNAILRGVDRDFTTGYQPALGLAPDTSSSPMFGNILVAKDTALPDRVLAPDGKTVLTPAGTRINGGSQYYTSLNGLALTGQCGAVPFGVSQTANPTLLSGLGYNAANSTYRCGTDYGRQYMLATPSQTTSGVARATFNVGKEATGFVEFVGSRYYSKGEFTPYQFSTTAAPTSVSNTPGTANYNAQLFQYLQAAGVNPAGNGTALANYPVKGPYYQNMRALYGATDFDPTKPIAYRLRMSDWGYRTLGNESTNDRLTVGLEGSLGAYDYKMSLAHGEASGYQEMLDGYADTNKLVALLASGLYNPFLMPGQSQTPQAMAAVEATKVHGRLATGSTKVDQFLASITGPLMKLPAGDLSFAVGTDLRRESYGFSGTQSYNCVSSFSAANLLASNSVMGCPGNSSAPDMSRKVGAVYGELLIPVLKSLELSAALRYDRYQQIGSTTNPKVGFKFTPTKDLLFRGSYNTGFRAPTAQQINLGRVQLATTGTIVDPLKCPNPVGNNDPSCQLSSVPYMAGGNPNLKPEKSRQGSLGVAFSPTQDMTASIDYWQITMKDRIHNLTVNDELKYYSVFADNFERDANGNITLIQAGWINAGGSTTKGVDITGNWRTKLFGNRLDTTLSATKMISDKEQLISGTPMVQYVGNWTNTTLYLPWKVALSTTMRTTNVALTLSANYSSGYNDEDHTTYTTIPEFQKRKIGSYTTFNLVGNYTGFKDLTLTLGLINMFDRKPPFTWHNVDNVVGTGWDPRVADPRGMTATFSASYKFF